MDGKVKSAWAGDEARRAGTSQAKSPPKASKQRKPAAAQAVGDKAKVKQDSVPPTHAR